MPEQNLTAPYPIPPTDAEYLDDDDEEWVNQAPKGLRVHALTGVLFLLLFAVFGFWGGAVLQKHHDNKTATTRAAAALSTALSTRRGAGGGAGGTAFGGTGTGTGTGTGAGAGRTLGTVSDVEGTTVFVTDASGNIVKVNLAPTTKISKSTPATAADIQLGQSVVVTGTTGADGSTTAATVTIAPAASASAPAAGAPAPAAGGTATAPGGAGG